MQGFNITAVERDTGLSKDLLRMWERRYGFPSPQRDQHGERVYSTTEVERLRLIKRLIDRGFRPGKLLSSAPESLLTLLNETTVPPAENLLSDWNGHLELLRQGDLGGLRNALQQQIMRQGLQGFVLDTAAPLTVAVGEAWMQGQIRVHEEHAYSELLKSLLRQAMSILGDRGSPILLLTTVPEEEHGLGLLMAEVLFMLEGAQCISLGIRTPLLDIADAARQHGVDCVGLSFSASFPPRQAAIQLKELRQLLPEQTGLWIGGAGSERILLPEGIERGIGPHGPADLIAAWRHRQPSVHST